MRAKKKNKGGFAYYLSGEVLNEYRKKPPELRLRWLYMANLLRMSCPAEIIESHNRFRNPGK